MWRVCSLCFVLIRVIQCLIDSFEDGGLSALIRMNNSYLQRTYYVSILETIRLMMFREMIGVYFENRMKVIIKFSGQN
jgi:hypothetical protein